MDRIHQEITNNMHWGSLLLLLAGGFGIGASFYLLRKTDRLKFMALFWTSFLFFFVILSELLTVVITNNFAEFILSQIIEWGHVYCITLILGALLLFIRESKPEFSRFPRFYAALPVALVLSYLLVYDTPVLKRWLLIISEAGAAIVAVVLYGMYSYYESIYRTIFAGAVLILITFIAHFFIPASLNLIWQIPLALGIGTLFTGYLIADKYYAHDYKS